MKHGDCVRLSQAEIKRQCKGDMIARDHYKQRKGQVGVVHGDKNYFDQIEVRWAGMVYGYHYNEKQLELVP